MTQSLGYLTSIFVGTFILEDAALVASIAMVSAGKLSFGEAFAACFLGISLGDIGLFLLGFAAARFAPARRIGLFKKFRPAFSQVSTELLTYSILISRVIPGTRLLTYLAAGFFGYSALKFLCLTLISVSLWVFVALRTGQGLHFVFEGHWVMTILIFLITLSVLKSLIPKGLDPWQRKALLHSWRKWLHFEFWPAWLFYLPIVPVYIYRSIAGRSFLLPFYANPQIFNGGLIGESKWDFLKHLDVKDSATLKSVLLPQGSSLDTVRALIEDSEFRFPLILKPDVGQRGYGVRIIKCDLDLEEYFLASAGTPAIVQTLSQFTGEAGIFYYRRPSEPVGVIFSITDKEFPFVTGDGIRSLGELILDDRRARIIAPVYFARHRARLPQILPIGVRLPLSECGNHCQGAIFKNGQALIHQDLLKRIDAISKLIPDFYFGRFDVRYKSKEQLAKGLDFEIVEVNGAGAEATHIWDSKTTLIEAYGVLFAQWEILFEIGGQVKRQNRTRSNISVRSFLLDLFRVIRRSDKLSISS